MKTTALTALTLALGVTLVPAQALAQKTPDDIELSERALDFLAQQIDTKRNRIKGLPKTEHRRLRLAAASSWSDQEKAAARR